MSSDLDQSSLNLQEEKVVALLWALTLQEWHMYLSCDPWLGSAWDLSSWICWPGLARVAKPRHRECWARVVAGLGTDSKGVQRISCTARARGTDWYPFEPCTLPTLCISPKEWFSIQPPLIPLIKVLLMVLSAALVLGFLPGEPSVPVPSSGLIETPELQT